MIGVRVNIKPFLNSVKKQLVKRILDRKLMDSIGRAGIKHIKNTKMFKSKNGENIRKGLSFTVGARSVTFHLDTSQLDSSQMGGGFYQNYGIRCHQMTYLKKAKRPIPMIAKYNNPDKGEKVGDLIFRWSNSMIEAPKKKNEKYPYDPPKPHNPKPGETGGYHWVHPGSKPKRFFEKGLGNMRKEIKERLQKDIAAYLRKR